MRCCTLLETSLHPAILTYTGFRIDRPSHYNNSRRIPTDRRLPMPPSQVLMMLLHLAYLQPTISLAAVVGNLLVERFDLLLLPQAHAVIRVVSPLYWDRTRPRANCRLFCCFTRHLTRKTWRHCIVEPADIIGCAIYEFVILDCRYRHLILPSSNAGIYLLN